MLKVSLKFNRFPVAYHLPEVQLSIFIRFMQILFGYMNPIVSGNRVSNRNPKNWNIENEKGLIHAAGFTLIGWDIIIVSQGLQPVDMLVFIAVTFIFGSEGMHWKYL